jgi:hypothetical protein
MKKKKLSLFMVGLICLVPVLQVQRIALEELETAENYKKAIEWFSNPANLIRLRAENVGGGADWKDFDADVSGFSIDDPQKGGSLFLWIFFCMIFPMKTIKETLGKIDSSWQAPKNFY